MSSNSKKTIILIGGAGYIGTVIANYFLNLNFNVIVYDNLIYNHDFALKDLKDCMINLVCIILIIKKLRTKYIVKLYNY